MDKETLEFGERIRSSIHTEVDSWQPDLERARSQLADLLDGAHDGPQGKLLAIPHRTVPALAVVAAAAAVVLVLGLTHVFAVRQTNDTAATARGANPSTGAEWCETGDVNVQWDTSEGRRRYGALPETSQLPVSWNWLGIARVHCLIGHDWTLAKRPDDDGVQPLHLRLKCASPSITAGVKIQPLPGVRHFRIEVRQTGFDATLARAWFWSPSFTSGGSIVSGASGFGYETLAEALSIDVNARSSEVVPVYFRPMCGDLGGHVNVLIRVARPRA